jgi:hypothetical protein
VRSKIVKTLMHKIGNAVYSALVEDYLADGLDAVAAHQKATRITETALVLIADSWLSLGLSSEEPAATGKKPDGLTTEDRLRQLMKLPPTNHG